MAISRLGSLHDVLSQTCDVICSLYGISREEAFARVECFIEENSRRWRLPEPAIDYHDPFCRMAYLYMNVAVHAALFEDALCKHAAAGAVVGTLAASGEELRVCALGGGPGSELLGLVRFIETMHLGGRPACLDFLLIDRVPEWDESWHALKQGIDRQLRTSYGQDRATWPVSISRSFLPLDVTAPPDFRNFATRFNGVHLFILCYLASEVKGRMADLRNVLAMLVNRAPSGALILVIDRDEREVRDGVQTVLAGLPGVEHSALVKQRGVLEDDLAELGEWYMNIEALPRSRWLAFSSLAQKRPG